MISAYKKLYDNEEFRVSLIKNGLERAKCFSWKNTVKIMLDTIDKDLKKKKFL
jgi:hypothetical protein